MHAGGNRIVLEGVEPPVMKVLVKSGLVDIVGEDCEFHARPARQQALDEALEAAEKWIANLQ